MLLSTFIACKLLLRLLHYYCNIDCFRIIIKNIYCKRRNTARKIGKKMYYFWQSEEDDGMLINDLFSLDSEAEEEEFEEFFIVIDGEFNQ